MRSVDIAVIGAGAAGLAFAHHLCAVPGGPSVALVEPDRTDPRRPGPRTWCYWETGPGAFDDLLTASWDHADVWSADGLRTRHPLGPSRYKMLRSDHLADAVLGRLARTPGSGRVTGTVTRVRTRPGHAEVTVEHAGASSTLRAGWVLDSRPRPQPPGGRTNLVQHFEGWFVRTERPAFDPAAPLLMDFRVPQPPGTGLAFGYLLPLDDRNALVEYTVFGRAPWPRPAYHQPLAAYLCEVLRVGDYQVTAVEAGAVPMTDAPHPRADGARHLRIGTAGGAVRPATGYSFATSQRQARATARAVAAGRPPVPPRPYPRRHLLMDAVVLRALDQGRIGPDFFTRLFRANRTANVLRFLDGTSNPAQELAVGLRSPLRPMLRSCLDLARHHLGSARAQTADPATEVP
ncbi:lycopene cyclase [Kitasatospora sp. RB6PN24]|uniref:lycopene cyclase family protein n=1 Tax=Kitasatospora humi TaxID=2893891 RepID=UPI001E3606A7|nr:lycopene cyclase family protein [Kitasatospora humi]MCC9311095.1 lycopene cyclase [Kitasatospora humi]